MTHEQFNNVGESAEKRQKNLRAPLSYFLPGIDQNFYEAEQDGKIVRRPKDVDRFAGQHLDVGLKINDDGIEQYSLKLVNPFEYRDIQRLILGLSGNRRRGLSIGSDEETQEEFNEDGELLIPRSLELLDNTAESLYTVDRAKFDFLRGSQTPRKYEAIWKNDDPERDVSGFISDIAEAVKARRELWRGRDISKASDADAISLFSRIRPDQRSQLLSSYLSSFDEQGKKDFIEWHMKTVNNANLLKISNQTVGFLVNSGHIMNTHEGEWVIPTRDTDNPVYVKIEYLDKNFVISSSEPDSVAAAVTWTRSTENGRALRQFVKNPSVAENHYLKEATWGVKLNHKVGDMPSSLLGFMFLDHIANIRNNTKGAVPPSAVPEDVFLRRNIILNTELIRRIESALA